MTYDAAPPYTVQHTDAVDADTVQRFARLARYWDLLANSGRFARTLPLVLQLPAAESARTEAPSAFWNFWVFADWLWQRHGSTQRLTPEQLVDALFDYLAHPARWPADSVRQALLADYVASGARANPKALQGWLPRREPPAGKAAAPAASRQARHQNAQTLPGGDDHSLIGLALGSHIAAA